MIVQAILAPIGACFVLDVKGLAASFMITAAYAFYSLFENRENGDLHPSSGSAFAVYVSLLCLGLFLIVYLTFFVFSLDELNFSSRCWNAGKKMPSPGEPCPFTGKEAEMQCPCCLTRIHSEAFYEGGPLQKGFVIGEGPCLWKQAQEAIETMEASAVHRVLLDEALSLRSNFLLGGVGDACIGCVTWMQSFQVYPKCGITLVCCGVISSLLPFAFHRLFLEIIQPRVLYKFMGGYGVFCGSAGVGVLWKAAKKARGFRNDYSFAFPIQTWGS